MHGSKTCHCLQSTRIMPQRLPAQRLASASVFIVQAPVHCILPGAATRAKARSSAVLAASPASANSAVKNHSQVGMLMVARVPMRTQLCRNKIAGQYSLNAWSLRACRCAGRAGRLCSWRKYATSRHRSSHAGNLPYSTPQSLALYTRTLHSSTRKNWASSCDKAAAARQLRQRRLVRISDRHLSW